MKIKKLVATVLCASAALSAFAFASCGENSDSAKVKLIDVKLTEEEYAFVIDKENDALVTDFNAFFADFKADGSFQKIMDKYFKGTGTKVGYPVSTGEVTNNEATFVVATNCPFEPFEYIGDDGKIYGLDIEVAAAYAEAKDLELVVKNIPVFDDIFTQVDNGYADIGMAGLTASEERKVLYNFTDTYYNASQQIIVAADNTDFDNCKTAEDVEQVLASLQNKKIGFQTGTTGNWYVAGSEDWGYNGFANIDAKGYQTAQDAVTDLINGNIYAVVVDNAPANAIVTAVNK